MRSRTPHTVVTAAAVSLGLATLQVVQPGCDCQDPAAVRVARAPVVPLDGVLARGSEIDDTLLGARLPPPPRDAVAYAIREPLRNGPSVPVKKRWVWIPDGSKIQVSRSSAGRVRLELPVGAKLWKEFYMTAGAKTPRLVERRILLKVPSRDADNGWLLNGGWRFYTAHHLPRRADGVHGYDSKVTARLEQTAGRRFFHRFERWLPTQAKGAPTHLALVGQGGVRHPYVFPGQTLCEYCHGGAAGSYANVEPHPVLTFALHPANLTVDSLKRLIERGWIDAPEGLAEHLVVRARDDQSTPAGRTRKMVGLLRNNCLSCHNPYKRAAAQDTGFVLSPARAYTTAELRTRLAVRSSLMGRSARPIVTPGRPAESELWLRLRGEQGRRRMPPTEGGVPERDEGLIKVATRWIEGMDQR
jgi:hypothetical protein